MFEFHAYDRLAHAQQPLAPREDRAAPAPADIAAISFLFWSEHCVECAAPACYATCALYCPRDDGRCRRFAYGIFRNARFAGPRGYGAEIAFRRWGKLKANGNTWMEPLGAAVRKERWLDRTIPVRRRLGRLAQMLDRETAWADPTRHLDRRARRLHRRLADGSPGAGGQRLTAPDAFLIEAYNPDDAPAGLELEMRIAQDLIDADTGEAAPSAFRHVVHFGSGHSRHVIPHMAFAAVTDCGLPFKLALTPIGEATPRLVFLALDFVSWRAAPATPVPDDSVEPPSIKGPAIKCIVFDLDDTLWQGTLVEGGAERLTRNVRQVLDALDRRGILLAIASRNNAEAALARLRDFGLADMFVATRIDWRAKSGAVADIAADLNLGLDTFAFVDDSAFERAEVAAALPEVVCFDARDLWALVEHPRLRGGSSAIARARRRLYREAARRDARRADFAGDEEAFLRSCRLRLEIAPYRPDDLARVVELAQRTNQLNASGNKYGPNACAALVDNTDLAKFVLRCADVHGDYGVVGFALIRFPAGATARMELRVEEFMLSCRVQGRRLEQTFFHYLASSVHAAAAGSLWINFCSTERNGPAARILNGLSFRPAANGGLALDLPAPHLATDLVEVVDRTDAVAAAARQAVA